MKRRSLRSCVVGLTAAALTVMAPAVRSASAEAAMQSLEPQRYPAVRPMEVPPVISPGPDAAEVAAQRPRSAPVWPSGAATVAVPAAVSADDVASRRAPAVTKAGSLPVYVWRGNGAAATLRVEMLPELRVRLSWASGAPAGAKAGVQVDYSAFREGYGAEWAARLRLVALPGCHGCPATELVSHNNLGTGRISSEVDVAAAGTTVALAAAPSSGSGDFTATATALSPSATWGHGGSTGGFTWKYPIQTPPALGGPKPNVALNYASQSVDGRHAATNNQPGWIGEGFDYHPGFIERRYKACADDMGGTANNTVKTGDLCWGPENAMLSLNGGASELLKSSDGKWHPRREDGSKIELLTGNTVNGDDNGEYWKVTTADGTQYFFGRHQLPGWTSGKPVTNAVSAVPVYGNNPGEPCYQSTFAASDCAGKNQGYRWNLDYIQDVHGNTMSLWYDRETNYYAKNNKVATPIAYHRGDLLRRIDYGTNNRSGTDSAYTTAVPARVEFTSADRCVSSCTIRDGAHWTDTPWDQACTATTNPCLIGSPTFWVTQRLSVITTKVWRNAAYQPVESWTLRHTYPDPGDTTRAGLWLAGVTHRGLLDGTLTVPEVTFSGVQMNNRVDATGGDFAPAMNWWRIYSIRSETGGETFVTYSARQCTTGAGLPAAADNNTKLCYPAKWTPQGYTAPITDHFHKYVVTEVQQIDHTGGAPSWKTRYEYANPGNLPLWHYDDDPGLVRASHKTWSQWRGFPVVTVRTGEGATEQKSETLYFRGMHGDKTASGTRTVSVTGREGGAAVDYDHFAGMPREQITWLGSNILSATVSQPWRSDPTASRSGTPLVEARFTGVSSVKTRQALDAGAWRRTTTTTTFDQYGMPSAVDDRGDDAISTDDRCTVTEYARSIAGSAWLLNPVKRKHSWAGACATPPASANQIISDHRTQFDGLAYGAAPTKGVVTAEEDIASFSAGTRTYQTVSTFKADVHGRVIEQTDTAGEKTATAYTPATGGPLTGITETNPMLWTTVKVIDPGFGNVTKVTDPNLRVTEATYDPLGRVVNVWRPGRARASFPTQPSTTYAYTLSKTAPTAITTSSLDANGGYKVTHELFDSLLRARQTQSAAFGGGRIVTDTFYDAAGRTWKSNAGYYTTGSPGPGTFFFGHDADMPSQTVNTFDAAGRIVVKVLRSRGAEVSRTTTTHHGDHTSTIPPYGDTPTTVWTDARDRTTKLWQYHGPTPAGGYDETSYTYHPGGQLATMRDPAGNTWSHEYDIRGRQTKISDPDQGDTTFSYNTFGQLALQTGSRPGVAALAYTYDRLGRKTSVREGSITGAKRAEWTYDQPAKGVTKSASRWMGQAEYRSETVTVDAMYRPTQTRTIIPAAEGPLAGTYTSRQTYRADGSPSTITLPAIPQAGIAEETVSYDYDSTYATPDTLSTDIGGGVTHYVTDAGYSNLFQLNVVTRSTALTGAEFMQTGEYYDEATGLVNRRPALRSVAPSYLANATYQRNGAGDIIKIDDDPGFGAAARDTQCFRYDHLRRLTEAWTPASADCAAAPTAAGLGGPAKYWTTWSFGSPSDPAGRVGNRLSQVEHATASGDITTTYQHPPAGGAGPHRVSKASVTVAGSTTDRFYTYDAAGNTISRPGAQGTQTLTWDAESRLASIADPAGASSYVYDATGARLLTKDPGGSTIHLGDTEIRLTGTTVSATRYYTFSGKTVATRSSAGLTWLAADHNGTGQFTVTADAVQTVTARRQTPFGTLRGTTAAWPTPRGFVDGYQDRTGLVHLGAREYDPVTGRFLSVDPVIELTNAQQWHAYSYGHHSPVTFSDPSGLKECAGSWTCDAIDEAPSKACTALSADRCADQSGLNGDGNTGRRNDDCRQTDSICRRNETTGQNRTPDCRVTDSICRTIGDRGRGDDKPKPRPLEPVHIPQERKKDKGCFVLVGAACALMQKLGKGTVSGCLSGAGVLVTGFVGELCFGYDQEGGFMTVDNDRPGDVWGVAFGVGVSVNASNARTYRDLETLNKKFTAGPVSVSQGLDARQKPSGTWQVGGGYGFPARNNTPESTISQSQTHGMRVFNWCGPWSICR